MLHHSLFFLVTCSLSYSLSCSACCAHQFFVPPLLQRFFCMPAFLKHLLQHFLCSCWRRCHYCLLGCLGVSMF
eukprot:jgi/Botrbrau1/19126/Bobra.0077s0038.1